MDAPLCSCPPPVVDIEALIKASSLGTPEAVALRATTPSEVASAIVLASKYLERAENAEAELERVKAGRALEQTALANALPIVAAAHDAKAALTQSNRSASARASAALLILADGGA
jgi:hypothetical protein